MRDYESRIMMRVDGVYTEVISEYHADRSVVRGDNRHQGSEKTI